MAVDRYPTAGYPFLAFSDHNISNQGQRRMTLQNLGAEPKGDRPRGTGRAPGDACADYLQRFGLVREDLRGPMILPAGTVCFLLQPIRYARRFLVRSRFVDLLGLRDGLRDQERRGVGGWIHQRSGFDRPYPRPFAARFHRGASRLERAVHRLGVLPPAGGDHARSKMECGAGLDGETSYLSPRFQ